MISLRDKLFLKKRQNPHNQNYKTTYNLFRNRITRELKKAKRDYYKTFFDNNINNMKKTWKGIKDILNLKSKDDQHISQIYHNNKTISNEKDIANVFNNFFTNIGTNLDSEIPKTNIMKNPQTYLQNKVEQSLILTPTTPSEVTSIINSLDDSKSSGSCNVPIKLAKLATNHISSPLSDIYAILPSLKGYFLIKIKLPKLYLFIKKAVPET